MRVIKYAKIAFMLCINTAGATGVNGASDVIGGSGVPVLGALHVSRWLCCTLLHSNQLEMVLTQCLKNLRIDSSHCSVHKFKKAGTLGYSKQDLV